MNQSNDDDLRFAFERWRRQEAELAPPFPGITVPGHGGSPSERRPLRWLLPACVTAAAAAVLMVMLWLSVPRTPQPSSLVEALPRPLLQPAIAGTAFLGAPPSSASSFVSDFLQPVRTPFTHTLF